MGGAMARWNERSAGHTDAGVLPRCRRQHLGIGRAVTVPVVGVDVEGLRRLAGRHHEAPAPAFTEDGRRHPGLAHVGPRAAHHRQPFRSHGTRHGKRSSPVRASP